MAVCWYNYKAQVCIQSDLVILKLQASITYSLPPTVCLFLTSDFPLLDVTPFLSCFRQSQKLPHNISLTILQHK